MAKFKKTLVGFSRKQVTEYITAQELKSQGEKDTLKKRIKILEEEIKDLTAKINESKAKEKSVIDGLIRVEKLEQECKEKAEKRSALEIERLELFKKNWTEYAVKTCRNDYREVLNALDGYLADYTANVKKQFREGLNLTPAPDVVDEDALRLASLCRKLGILDE
ncbi:MAG: DivIVA domain-containing protein [Clostridia bacterium]|nr:DivIVA domain-containing protein [Clostridia bacterium]